LRLSDAIIDFPWADFIQQQQQQFMFPHAFRVIAKNSSECKPVRELLEALMIDVGENIGESVGIARMWQQLAEIQFLLKESKEVKKEVKVKTLKIGKETKKKKMMKDGKVVKKTKKIKKLKKKKSKKIKKGKSLKVKVKSK
jgi:hypothetical protein